MDGKVSRSDYLQIGLNSRGCLKIFDDSREEDDIFQVIVGDHSGSIQSIKIRMGKLYENMFKTVPTNDSMITSVETVSGSNKAFAIVGSQTIRGINKKGKQFFCLELNDLSEPIQHFKLRWPTDIYVCGQYLYNHYNLNSAAGSVDMNVIQLADSFICPAKITDMCILEDRPNNKIIPILSSDDRLIRLINGSSCVYELETNGIPTALIQLPPIPGKTYVSFCYGSSDGKTTMVSVTTGEGPSFAWEVPESGSRAGVECLTVSSTGKELLIGRADGEIEIWGFDGSLNLDGTENIDHDSAPVCRFTYSCNESITSLCISRDDHTVVASTFPGSVFGIEWKGITRRNIPEEAAADLLHRIEMLREECETLEVALVEEKAKFQASQSPTNKGSETPRGGNLLALPVFVVKDSLILNEDASYTLSLEVAVPIDVVILQSDIPIDITDSEKNSAVVSFSESETQEVLVTFRCQSNTTRLEVAIRTIEGQYGIMRLYVISRMNPKSCQVKQHQMRPLSLHKRSYSQPPESSEDICRLEITGHFSLDEGHEWVFLSLPEVPDRVVSQDQTLIYHFKSTLCATVLSCTISEGSLIFEADNVSTISILKDFITRRATSKGMRIEVSAHVGETSISSTLRKLYPLVKKLIAAKTYESLKIAALDLSQTDAKVAEDIINDLEEDFGRRAATQTISLDRVLGLITDLFIDEFKLKGKVSKSTLATIRNKVGELQSTLEDLLTGPFDESERELFVSSLKDFWLK